MEINKLPGMPKFIMAEFLRPENIVLEIVDAETNPEFDGISKWMAETALLGGLGDMTNEVRFETLHTIAAVIYSLGYRKGRASTPLTLVVADQEGGL